MRVFPGALHRGVKYVPTRKLPRPVFDAARHQRSVCLLEPGAVLAGAMTSVPSASEHPRDAQRSASLDGCMGSKGLQHHTGHQTANPPGSNRCFKSSMIQMSFNTSSAVSVSRQAQERRRSQDFSRWPRSSGAASRPRRRVDQHKVPSAKSARTRVVHVLPGLGSLSRGSALEALDVPVSSQTRSPARPS